MRAFVRLRLSPPPLHQAPVRTVHEEPFPLAGMALPVANNVVADSHQLFFLGKAGQRLVNGTVGMQSIWLRLRSHSISRVRQIVLSDSQNGFSRQESVLYDCFAPYSYGSMVTSHCGYISTLAS